MGRGKRHSGSTSSGASISNAPNRRSQPVPTSLAQSYAVTTAPAPSPATISGSRPLAGKRILVSGAIPGFKRRDLVLEALEAAGAVAFDDPKQINSMTDAVIVSALQKRRLEAGEKLSRKVTAALDLGIPLIGIDNEDDFRDVLDGRVI